MLTLSDSQHMHCCISPVFDPDLCYQMLQTKFGQKICLQFYKEDDPGRFQTLE